MLSLNNFFSFKGVSGRKNYILSLLILIAVEVILSIAFGFLGLNYNVRKLPTGADPVSFIIFIIFALSFLALSVKRGRSIGVHPVLSVLFCIFLPPITLILYVLMPPKLFK